jgi:hypothetical protein
MRTLEETRTATATPTLFDVGRLEEAGLRVAQLRYEPAQTIFMAGDPRGEPLPVGRGHSPNL